MKPRCAVSRPTCGAGCLAGLFLWLLSAVGLPAQTPTNAALDLRDTPFRKALGLYEQLCDRNLLVHPAVRGFKVTLQIATTNRTLAALALEQVFASNNVVVFKDGAKFAQLLPQGMTNEARLFASAFASDSPEVYVQAGSVDFTGAEVQQVACFYASALRRKINPESLRPTNEYLVALKSPIFFRNQTALSRAEFIRAMDVLFAWHGLKFEPDGEEFIKPVRFARR